MRAADASQGAVANSENGMLSGKIGQDQVRQSVAPREDREDIAAVLELNGCVLRGGGFYDHASVQ